MEKIGRLTVLFFALAVASALLHNLVSGLLGVEDFIFFTLTFIFLIACVILALYNLTRKK
ncbi:MAG: hypothetical protein AABX71_01310 [Nanoarchaeota archaeon]